MFSKILIAGLGLMGGSIAKLISETKPETVLFGLSNPLKKDVEKDIEKKSEKNTLFKKIYTHIHDIDEHFDLVIICTPIDMISSLISALSKQLKGAVIFTDVASIKKSICDTVQLHHPDHCFIGGHPMAGLEKTGFTYSQSDLLKGKNWFLVPCNHPEKNETLQAFLESLSINVIFLSAEEHDYLLAHTSHLPYLVSVLTVLTANDGLKDVMNSSTGYASGFKDVSRLAASNPDWGKAICEHNRSAILEALETLQHQLAFLKSKLEEDELETLLTLYQTASKIRKSIYP